MKLEIERKIKTKNSSKEVAFYVNRGLVERFQAKVKAEGGGNYSKVIEALMRWYLGEKLTKK